MKLDEVVAASGGKAVPTTTAEAQRWKDGSLSARLKTPHSIGPYQFIAFFYFSKSDDLSMVLLALEDVSLAHNLVGELRLKYGKETDGFENDFSKYYVWREGSDYMNFIVMNFGNNITGANLRYRPQLLLVP
jgi:hypothetical protein